MTFTLYKWNGQWLKRAEYGWAKAVTCCCIGEGECCGRNTPGIDSLEGEAYYPLVLHVTITKGTCTCPASPISFDITWNPAVSEWQASGISMGSSCGTLSFSLGCNTPNWDATITWPPCTEGGDASIEFEMVPTLTGGECDPVDLIAQNLNLTGLSCCGSMMGGTITVEVIE